MWLYILSCCVVMAATEVPTIKLQNGFQMPAIALGTFVGVAQDGELKSDDHQVRDAVLHAIDIGYRHIDTAFIYGSERQIGKAINMKIQQGIVKREDIFLTTKLWNIHHRRDQVEKALRDSLQRMQLEYVDLYLIHWPMGLNEDYTFSDVDYIETWRGMEDVVKLGLAKSIGLSNFNKEQIMRVIKECEIRPVVLQIEVHPSISQTDLVSYCESENIVVMGYSPFGSLVRRYGILFPGPRIDDPTLVEIAQKYGKTVTQIVLRWQIDRHIVPVPKTVNPKRLEENINVFDFKLTEDEIAKINSFNMNKSLIAPSFWQEHKYYPFEKVDNPMSDPFRA